MTRRYLPEKASEPTLDSVYRSSPTDVFLYVGVAVVCILAFWPQ